MIAAGTASAAASAVPRAASWARDAPRAASSAASGSRCPASRRTETATAAATMTSRISTPISSWERATSRAVPSWVSRAGSEVVTAVCGIPARLPLVPPSLPSPAASRWLTAARFAAPCPVMRGVASQAAETTGTPLAAAAGVVTSGP